MTYKVTILKVTILTVLILLNGLITSIWANEEENLPVMLLNSCIICHGIDGSSAGPATPTIAGMDSEDFIDMMEAYKNNEIPSTIMGRIAKGYNEKDFQVMANYFSKKTFRRFPQQVEAQKVKNGQKLHKEFCERCHENEGYTVSDEGSGILAGQWMPYLQFSLTDFQTGSRDMPKKMKKRMQKMVKKHGETSLEDIVHFYGSLTEQK